VTTRVAFLRAVNLGKRRVANARLVELVEGLGYTDVWAHINSGNVAFDATGSRTDVERKIRAALEDDHGFEVTTFVRTAAELRKVVAEEPFTVRAGDTYYVTFLAEPLGARGAKQLEALSNDFDTLVVRGRDVHWLMHGKSTDTHLKTKDWEAVVGVKRSTSRNITMLRKLVAKLDT
jgi:uncharacterized protein (DUF1697 family)